jgi:signal transduction histidine kinase
VQVGVVVAAASVLTGVANVGLFAYLGTVRERPGRRWFRLVIAAQAVFCLSYGVGLFVGDGWLREPLLMAFWLSAIWIGVLYLAFALDYTGRGDYVHAWPFRAIVAVQTAASLLVVTFPYHDIGPTDIQYVPYGGVDVAVYPHDLFLVFEFLTVVALATLGVFLLLDTVVSYGPLYRKHAVAIAITPIPPTLAFLAWVLEIGPLYPLNLTPIAFFPHLLLDLYALFGEDMFEFPPATRRAAERAAIDDLGNPVAVVDPEDRIVRLNPAAASAFGVTQTGALTTPIGAYLEADATGVDADHVRVAGDPDGRVYARTRTELVDGTGTVVGATVVLQDVTAERRREQRVAVLNRVLRHNLRNDLNVVHGNVTAAMELVDDETASGMLETAAEQAAELSALGERAREVDTTMSRSGNEETFQVAPVLADIAESIAADADAWTIDLDVPEDLSISADPEIFRVVFENLIENGLRHDPGDDPRVTASVVDDPGTPDAGSPDTESPDAGSPDAGSPDAESPDARSPDAESPDAGSPDAGSPDAGSPDAESPDAESPDTESPDAGSPDAESPDAGSPDAGRETVTFAVADSGPGIPEHELAVLDAAEESSLEHGSGLGLWVANWGVTAMGGDLAFETGASQSGERGSDGSGGGTTAYVTLPVEDPASSSERA